MDTAQAGVNTIGESKINNPLNPAKRDCLFCPVAGQGIEPLALTAGHNKCQNLTHHSESKTPIIPLRIIITAMAARRIYIILANAFIPGSPIGGQKNQYSER